MIKGKFVGRIKGCDRENQIEFEHNAVVGVFCKQM